MAWKNNNQTFDAMAIYDFSGPGLNLGSGDRPEQVKGIHVSKNTSAFSASLQPRAGRSLRRKINPAAPKLHWSATLSGNRDSGAIPLWLENRSSWEAIRTTSLAFSLPASVLTRPPTFSSPCRRTQTPPTKGTIC